MRRAAGRIALALAALMILGAPAIADAAGKDKKPAARAAARAAAKSAATKSKTPGKVAERNVSLPAPATTTAANRDETAAGDRDGATPTTTPATGKTLKTRTYTFGAMDVEGKLKTPQLLYFLNRVKLELDMSAPDKRSFMKELAGSADDKNL